MKPLFSLRTGLAALTLSLTIAPQGRAQAPAAKSPTEKPAASAPAKDASAKPDATKPATVPAKAKPAPAKPVVLEPADQPSPKKGPDGQIQATFAKMHESFLARRKEPIGVLFLGDSITQGWSGAGKQIWAERYAKYDAANFGIGGDRTQHVLWRIQEGELEGIKPKVVVLMIGTNNSAYPAEAIIKGDKKIVEQIRKKLPQTKLLLLGIFPRGAEPTHPARAKLKTVNEALAKLDDGKHIFYLDIGDKFLDAAGNIPKEIMPDALHPNAEGYKIWADAIQAKLDGLMK